MENQCQKCWWTDGHNPACPDYGSTSIPRTEDYDLETLAATYHEGFMDGLRTGVITVAMVAMASAFVIWAVLH